MKIKLLVIAGMCISTGAFAGGYRVALQGQSALGMGHTGVAMTDSAEVVFFNPAGMSSLKMDSNFASGITLINSTTKYQNATANIAAETNNPTGTPIYLYYSKRFDQNISYGLGVYTPFGNAVEWPKDWAGSHLVNNISLKTIFVQPTISYKINNMFSVGFGPTYINGQVELNRNLSTDLVDANGDRSNVTIEASGITAWGLNAGILAKPTNSLSIGLNYRTRSDLKAKGGTADFENVPTNLPAETLAKTVDTKFDSELVLPAELTIGMSYAINSNTTIAADINRTFWSAYESLDLKFDTGSESIGPRNYNDANVYRIGIQHKLNPNLTVRAGAYYDDTPISSGYHTPETPRNDSKGLTAGASFKMSKRMDIDFSFLYLMFAEFNGSYDHIRDDDPATPDASFGGDYISSVTSFGFGLNYKY